MRATIGWSYDLLPEPEQALFRGLGVFAGSFELEAAEAVCDADLDSLQSLVEKSLLRRDGHGRFFLLELTREYALEQLHAAGETDRLGRRHAEWFLQLAKRAEEHLRSAEQGVWLARLDADTDNFRAVLAWCTRHDPAGAIELATTLYWPWRMHGRLRELSSWLERALAMPEALDIHTRSRGLGILVDTLWFSNQSDRMREPLEESLALCRELGDKSGEAHALLFLGATLWAQGSVSKTIELQEAALGMWRDAGDRDGVERATNWLGGMYLDAGDAERSATMLEESVAMSRESGDYHGMAGSLGGLGDAELAKNDPEKAARHFREQLGIDSDLGDERGEIYAVAGLACAAALQGDLHSAGRLWGIVETSENQLGMELVSGERARYERILTPLQDDQAFQAGYQAGRDIDLADAVRELLAT